MDAFVGLADAARLLNVSWAVAWRLALVGRLDAEKRGLHWYVSRSSVERLARQRREPQEPASVQRG